MHFQGRGNVYLRELDADLNPGPAKLKLCTDSFNISFSVETGTHQNRCGAVDVEDARFIKSQSASITMALATLDDKYLAMGLFGTVNALASGSVTDEDLPTGIEVGDYYFLGGKTRHRGITALTITTGASPGVPLVANTDYTLNAATGMVTFLTASGTQPYNAAYTYADPQYVSIYTAGQKKYCLDYEFLNKQDSNNVGSLELYQVIFDPPSDLDMQSDELQIMSLTGSALADTERTADTLLGQFGRRVL